MQKRKLGNRKLEVSAIGLGRAAEAAKDVNALLLAVHWSRINGQLAYDGKGGPELAYRFERFAK